MKNILFLIHTEESMRQFYPHGYEGKVRRLARRFDYVIHCTSHIDDDLPTESIAALVDECIHWAWGYEHASFADEPDEARWIIPVDGIHEWTWVPPALRDATQWHHCNITIAGGADQECLTDFEAVLQYQGLTYRRAESCIF